MRPRPRLDLRLSFFPFLKKIILQKLHIQRIPSHLLQLRSESPKKQKLKSPTGIFAPWSILAQELEGHEACQLQ